MCTARRQQWPVRWYETWLKLGVFGWSEFCTVHVGKHCLYWNVVREKYCSGWKNKPNKLEFNPAEQVDWRVM